MPAISSSKIFLLFVCVAAWSTLSLAQPSISSVSGSLAEGSSLTINGSGFGTAAPTILLWDNFENGMVGQKLGANPKIGTWQLNEDGGSVPTTSYASDFAHSGTKAAKWSTAITNWGNFNVIYDVGTIYLYQSFWFRWTDTSTNYHPRKVTQVHGDHTGCDFTPGINSGDASGDWWKTDVNPDPNNCTRPFPSSTANWPVAPSQGAWHHLEFIGKQSTVNVANGTVIVRLDGQDMVNWNGNVMTRVNPGDAWYLIEFFNGAGNGNGTTTVWIDDAYLSSGWNRVVISDSPTWAAANTRHTEIQVPVSWASGQIVVTLNKGSLSTITNNYLYVVDSRGNANANGFLLSGSSLVKTPAGLSVQ